MIPGTPSPERAALHDQLEKVWGNPRGWRALSLVNHSTVAQRFMVTGGVFFVLAGLLSMLMRAQLALPNHDFMGAEAYNQAFTMHGTIMMFLFAVPILQGLAAYLLPKMLGARDLVFPRLSSFGYWCYLFGGIIFCSSLLFGLAPDAGWFMYTPLSSNVYTPGLNSDFWLLGITFVEIATMAAGIEIAVSILRTRAAGMSLDRMPVFAWSMLVTSLMIVVGFPPLILGSILLELERAAGWAFFDTLRGGDPLLWAHLFWLFGHPEVYIVFLPAAGVISTIVPVFARRPLVGYRWVVVSLISIGFISFGLWVHHMFTLGIPALGQAFFSAASMLVGIPTGVQLFSWIATLWTGRPVWRAPMLWVGAFLTVFVAGGLTGVMLALVPFNWQVHDTHFVVAHFHYVLVGGMLFPLLAGVYYWLPHFSGRMPSERLSKIGFWVTFVGFNGTFLVMHWTGLLGMPRRVYTYDSGLGWDLPNLISSVFSFLMAFGVATVLLDIALHFRFGRKAPPNPWGADTMEWAMTMPPPSYNFASQPALPMRHPLWDAPELPDTVAEGRHALAEAGHGRRETLGSDPVSGRPREVFHLPGSSWLPLISSLLLALLCILLLLKLYVVALVTGVAVAAVLLRWSWLNGGHPCMSGTESAHLPDGLKLHTHTFDGPGLWGMGLTMLADASLYGSLVFGWLFLWTVAPSWQPPAVSPIGTWPLLGVALLLGAGRWSMQGVVKRLRGCQDAGDGGDGGDAGDGAASTVRREAPALLGSLWTAVGCALAAAAGLVALLLMAPLAPTHSAHDAMLAFLLSFLLLHTLLALVLSVLQALRVRRGYVGMKAPYEPVVVSSFWSFTAGAAAVGWLAFALLPLAFAR